MKRAIRFTVLLTLSAFALLLFAGTVTPQRLLDSAKEPQNWLTYSGGLRGHRFKRARPDQYGECACAGAKWAYQTMGGGKFETTPIVVDGVLVRHRAR